jgi:hypothetical protein
MEKWNGGKMEKGLHPALNIEPLIWNLEWWNGGMVEKWNLNFNHKLHKLTQILIENPLLHFVQAGSSIENRASSFHSK